MVFLSSRPALRGVAVVVVTMALWTGVTCDCPRIKDVISLSGSFRCEKECMSQGGKSVYGTLVYGEDSDACLAGLHAGALGLDGGILVAQRTDNPERRIQATCRNRVCSQTLMASGPVYTMGNGTFMTDRVGGDVLLIHNNYGNEELNVLCLSEDPRHEMSSVSIRRWNYGDIGEPKGTLRSPSKVITTSSQSENRHAFHCLGRTPASDVFAPVIFRDAEYKTTQYTFRASKGDALQVKFSQPNPLPLDANARRFPGEEGERSTLDYDNVQPDVTALYLASNYKSGAYFNIIVRDCEAGKFGNRCQHTCPKCKNGGECHSNTGECVCPPGFTGNLCQKACPKGYIGNDCELHCSEKEFLFRLPVIDSCEGLTFCLPSPLGCSCAAGYKGVLCDQSCGLGEYGAGCTGSCQEKCQANDCDPVTGKCPPSLPKNMKVEVASPRTLTLSWDRTGDDEEEHQDKLYYHVGYKLLTHMSCDYKEQNEKWNRIIVENQPIVISGLQAHASYNVCLYVFRESDSKTTAEECYTAETGVEVPTVNVTELVCTPDGSENILCSATIEGTCAHYNGPNAELSFSLSYEDCNGTNVLIEESELLPPAIDQFHSGVINHIFSGLMPGQKFVPAVKVKRVPVPEQRAAVLVYTEEKAPPPVKDLKVFPLNETDVKVMWNAPCPSNGKIMGYNITVDDEVYEISPEDGAKCSDVESYQYCLTISHLKMDSTYNVQITVGTSHFQSQASEFEFRTFAKPGEPLLQKEERDRNALGVSIKPPTFTGGRLQNCTVAGPKASCVIPYEENIKTMKCEIKNLKSGTKYTLEAYCCNVMFCGEKLKIEMVTRPSPLFRGSARVDDITNSTIPLILPKLTNTGETKSNFVVFVKHIPKDAQNQRQDLRNESLEILNNYERSRQGKKDNSQDNPSCDESTWIAAVLPGTNETIEVGDGGVHGGIYNCPLKQGESYLIGVLGITDLQGDPKYQETVWQQLEPVKLTTQPGPKEHLMLVIVYVEGALLLIIVLVLIIILCRYCNSKKGEEAAVKFTKEPVVEGGEEPAYRADV
ncbi:uncharacterized protein LOC135217129 isoform X2 [Macrobrachium nipponense]|uniref:uncharacterized protein LOC135217129 isoform X2 n=1 Tax=Macrobrachium nipponense TaxID=159736 RepID=UPI0030C873A4